MQICFEKNRSFQDELRRYVGAKKGVSWLNCHITNSGRAGFSSLYSVTRLGLFSPIGLLFKEANFLPHKTLENCLWSRCFQVSKITLIYIFLVWKWLWCRYFGPYKVWATILVEIADLGYKKFQNNWSHCLSRLSCTLTVEVKFETLLTNILHYTLRAIQIIHDLY